MTSNQQYAERNMDSLDETKKYLANLAASEAWSEGYVNRAFAKSMLHIIALLETRITVETPVAPWYADEERKALIDYHGFHGRQMPDPMGAKHRERESELKRLSENGTEL